VKIVISGLTAAGKSTHGRLLAEHFDLPYFSATDVLARLVAGRSGEPPPSRWEPALDDARGEDVSIDDELDEILLRTFRNLPGVFDACLLPWVGPEEPTVRVWIESDLTSRLRKCVVSHWDEGVGPEEVQARVARKDAFTIGRLRDAHDEEYGPDDRFDVIASNTSLIPVARPAAAEAGIRAFHPVLAAAVGFSAAVDAQAPSSPWLLRLRRAAR